MAIKAREFLSKLIFLIVLFKTIKALPSLPDIDASLSSTNEGIIYGQAALVKRLNELSALIQTCNDGLKSQNLAPKLLSFMEIVAQLVQQFSTMDYFEVYENVSTCSDVNYKITLMDFDVRKYRDVIVKGVYNTSQLSPNYAWANHHFIINSASLGSLKSTCSDAIKRTSALFTEYARFNQILAVGISTTSVQKAYLSAFKRSYCQCLSKVSWTGANSTLTTNINLVRQKIVSRQANLVKVTKDNLKQISTTLLTTTSALRTNLQALQKPLNNIASASDYSTVSWPKIPNCNDLYSRIDFVKTKQWEYQAALTSASYNRSQVTINKAKIVSTVSTSKDLNKDQLLSIQLVINGTCKVEKEMENLISQLIFSSQKMALMIGDMQVMGDTYCTCESESMKTTTTISSDTSATDVTDESSAAESSVDGDATTAEMGGATTKSSAATTTKGGATTTKSRATTTKGVATTTKGAVTTSTKGVATTTNPGVATTDAGLATTDAGLATTIDGGAATTTNAGAATTTNAGAATTTNAGAATTTTELPTTTTELPTTTTTTELPTTTTTTLGTTIHPCGTFLPYTDPSAVSLYGVDAGVFKDGTIAYVGYGNNSACFDEQTCPARISAESPNLGAYMTCFDQTDEVHDPASAFYLVDNPRLVYVPTNATEMYNVTGILQITTGGFLFGFGRVNYVEDDYNYTTVCKVLMDSKGMGAVGCYFHSPTQEIGVDTDFEVLACI